MADSSSSPFTKESIDLNSMFDMLNTATLAVKHKLDEMGKQGEEISITAMFEMQLLMNKLSQLSEMSTSVVSASHSAISSMARNVKS